MIVDLLMDTIDKILFAGIGFLAGVAAGVSISKIGLIEFYSKLPPHVSIILSFLFWVGIIGILIIFSRREDKIEQIKEVKK
ncbi:MAG: hypothetical protein ACTSVB_04485 [Candidatus Heimdallarchaeaceae archaeon]